MGIYINMEMPTSCFYCFARQKIDPDNIRCLVTGDVFEGTFAGTIEKRMSGCPLVPVPPHGRLIDVDYADEYAYDVLEVANAYLTGWEAARAMQKIYQSAPTIIPAEEGELG